MKIGMVVLAGGVGKRIGQPFPKQFLLLGGKPLIVHVLEKARVMPGHRPSSSPAPICSGGSSPTTVSATGSACILGGGSRQEFVYKGLAALEDCNSVIIHEAVRPLVHGRQFETLIATRTRCSASRSRFRVLEATYIEEILERDELVNVQLPQKFDRASLMAAHGAGSTRRRVQEDASLFHRYAEPPVRILPGCGAQHQDHRADRHRHRRGDLRRRHRSRGLTMGKVCVITGASRASVRAAAVRMSREPAVDTLVLIAGALDGTVAMSAKSRRSNPST